LLFKKPAKANENSINLRYENALIIDNEGSRDKKEFITKYKKNINNNIKYLLVKKLQLTFLLKNNKPIIAIEKFTIPGLIITATGRMLKSIVIKLFIVRFFLIL
jgi:hypothetical protein